MLTTLTEHYSKRSFLSSKVCFMHESSSDFTFDSIAQKFLLRELVGGGEGMTSIVFLKFFVLVF